MIRHSAIHFSRRQNENGLSPTRSLLTLYRRSFSTSSDQVVQSETAESRNLGEKITILAEDGFKLHASLFKPLADDHKAPVVIINSATGVQQIFYRRFADYLTEYGCHVVTYDYRGIGGSVPKGGLRAVAHATYADWGLKDQGGVIKWVTEHYQGRPLVAVGHSVGAQFLPLGAQKHHFTRTLAVTAFSAYWRINPHRVRAFLAVHYYFPALCAVLPYFPSKLGGLSNFADLPVGVVRQWCQWMKQPDYLLSVPEIRQAYKNFHSPTLYVTSDADEWGKIEAVKWQKNAWRHALACHTHFRKEGYKGRKISHMAFFRPEFRDTLWAGAAEWIVHGHVADVFKHHSHHDSHDALGHTDCDVQTKKAVQ